MYVQSNTFYHQGLAKLGLICQLAKKMERKIPSCQTDYTVIDGRERMKSNHVYTVQDGKGGGDRVFRRVVK